MALALVSLLIATLGFGALYASWASGGRTTGTPVQIIVAEGASTASIANQLARAHVIRSAFYFKLVARWQGVERGLKPGAYNFRTGMTVAAVIDKLKHGIPLKVYRLTIPEGQTLTEIATNVGAHTHISRAAFLAAARSGRHRPAILPRGITNLEGLLFPDTYNVVEKMDADDVVKMLVDEFDKRFATIDVSRATSLRVTPYQGVVLASLIEREAKVDRDRPLIASVIYNRLKRGMLLQIDATIQYILLQTTGHYHQIVLFKDLEIPSPYNTYKHTGLPPGPIASPGLPALRAAFAPATTDYLYYRTTNDQTHCFARTSSEFARCGRG